MVTQRLLARGREAAERLMTDTCTITRITGEYETDPETGQDVPVVEDVYSGHCKLQSTPQTGEHRESGESRLQVETPRLHLPYNTDLQPGDVATITATETGNVSTDLKMTLTDLNRGTHRTSQRWNVEVTTQ